jgi:nucleotide-binding universal stress UspA family protein
MPPLVVPCALVPADVDDLLHNRSVLSGGTGRIFVGVDGSEHARQALRWAVDEARLREWVVIAVHAHSIPPMLVAPAPGLAAAPPPDAALLQQLEESAEKLLADEIRQVDTDDVTIEARVVSGSAADALLQAAAEGDLLVVGSRGHGGFRGLLLGSVSQQVAHHAPCPVVIVPPAERD